MDHNLDLVVPTGKDQIGTRNLQDSLPKKKRISCFSGHQNGYSLKNQFKTLMRCNTSSYVKGSVIKTTKSTAQSKITRSKI